MEPKRTRLLIQDEDSGGESDSVLDKYLGRQVLSSQAALPPAAAASKPGKTNNAGSTEESSDDGGVEEGKGGGESEEVKLEIPKRNANIFQKTTHTLLLIQEDEISVSSNSKKSEIPANPFTRKNKPEKRKRTDDETGLGVIGTERTSHTAITFAMNSPPCCNRNHFLSYSSAMMIPFMEHHRRKFWERPRDDQNELLTIIGSQRGIGDHSRYFVYQFEGLQLCRTGLCTFLGVSLKRWERYTDRENPVRRLRKTRRFAAPKRERMLGWMLYYFALRGKSGGDWMPDDRTNKTLHISYTEKTTIYQDMRIDLITNFGCEDEEVPGYSYFIETLNDRFAHVKIGGVKQFAKCDRCSELDLQAANTKHRPTLKKIGRLKKEHKKLYMTEKEKYWHRIVKAILEPSRYMISIGDGMDQSKTETPWFLRPPYSFNKCATAGFGVQGIINHSHDPKTVAFVVADVCKKGGNFAMEWLVRDLTMV
jgi:hypothetical protein